MFSKKTDRKNNNKKNKHDGHWHSSPQFCIQAFLKTRYHSGGKVQKSLKRGVVGGKVALQIKLEANTLMHIRQADLYQSQVCC